MGITIVFTTCYVCGEDVATFPGKWFAACTTHSPEDCVKALDGIEAQLNEERQFHNNQMGD